jgi:hypothetical protein
MQLRQTVAFRAFQSRIQSACVESRTHPAQRDAISGCMSTARCGMTDAGLPIRSVSARYDSQRKRAPQRRMQTFDLLADRPGRRQIPPHATVLQAGRCTHGGATASSKSLLPAVAGAGYFGGWGVIVPTSIRNMPRHGHAPTSSRLSSCAMLVRSAISPFYGSFSQSMIF